MFEGLVRQLLLGYLGRYVKDIQKEQLKITLWNEEVLLENVELILEAFDYLQLPFALKQGRVGRLSIKIPWKKLGWDPIIIILEDVFISATQRSDQEWSAEAVEKREFAGKRAKLAAAELGKLSRRVCGSHAGQSFISYISAKILDSIQVAIRNFHVLYSDIQNDLEHIMIGLKFSSLTILKQHLVGLRIGEVNKTVEIRGLEFYSNMFHGSVDLMTVDGVGNSNSDSKPRLEGQSYKSILVPCEVSFMLSANRSEKVDDNAPQYSVTAELTDLVISIGEAQLQQMFLVWDYVCTCRLREKYGRYRPWHSPLPRKLEGWQILWWHYAQESVLSDVCKRLKKTSWRYLWERLSYRRKYINLYKTKLNFLQQEQPVDDNVLQDLEQMEKESDVDDILNYRSAAEYQMQECFSRCSSPETGKIGTDTRIEKSHNEEHSSGKSRGWLNWLSRGMLGAGGTDDCSQFSGVVSDDVIKDIYEATEFHPLVSTNGDVATKDELFCAMKFQIHEISATLHSKRHDQIISEIIIEDGIFESKLYNGRTTVISKIKSAKMIDSVSKNVILHTCRPAIDNEVLDIMDHSCSIQVDFSSNSDIELSVKGTLQKLDMTVDIQILSNLMVFSDVFTSFRFQNERVLASLNGIDNVNTRLSSKTKCVFANRKKAMWDITIINVSINVPWRNKASEYSNLVMMSKSISFVSSFNLDIFFPSIGEQPYSLKSLLNSISASGLCLGIELHDLYNYFEVKLDEFEITMRNSDESQKVSVLEKFSASIFLACCLIPDESILKQLEVYVLTESLNAHISPSIYGSFIELGNHLCTLHLRDGSEFLEKQYARNMVSIVPTSIFGLSINSNLGSLDLRVDLENNADNSSFLSLSLKEIDIWYASMEFQDILISTKSFMISSSKMKDKNESHVLILSGNYGPDNEADQFSDVPMMADACFAIHYESPRDDLVCHKCTVFLNNVDIHCYPYLVGLFNGFFDRLSAYGTDADKSVVGYDADISKIIATLGLQKFGFSNYSESESSECSSIPLDHFPFVTIYNSGSLCNLESSLLYTISDWRNYVTLRDRKIRNSESNRRRGSKFYHLSASKPKFDFGYLLESGIGGVPNIISMEVHLCGIRIHFHDSSCIVGTITVPASNSTLFFCEDSMDILCSTKGLVLSSSWWTRKFHDYLWGPSSDDFSPILNLRARKGQFISSSTELEVSISIQHVHCMLPPEYLSIIIGYFSLPDWGGNSTDPQRDVENGRSVTYKFEILDSHLVCPVENNECHFLRVEIEQLYSSFIHNSCLDNVIKDITPECLVPVHKLFKQNHCLNMFGRDLFLSFLSVKNDMFGLSTVEQDSICASTTLIAHLSADVWVTIPFGCESNCSDTSPLTCVMTKISNCQIVAEDSHFFDGCLALWDVIDHFSLLGYKSQCFESDVLQFLHSKRSTDIRMVSPSAPGSSTEVKFSVQSLLIDFYRCKEDSVELMTKAELQFNGAASLVDDSIAWFDLGFSSLALCSVHDSIVLAKCTSAFSTTHVLDISFSKSIGGENELRLCLPSVEIWLHLSNWIEVIDFFNNFHEYLAKTSPVDASSNSFPLDTNDSLKKKTVRDHPTGIQSESTSAHFASEEMEDASFLMIRSDIIGITFHIPVWICEEPRIESQPADNLSAKLIGEPSDRVDGKDSKHITVYLNINSFELSARGKDIQLKSYMDKLSGMIIIVENKRHSSWPLFEIVQVTVEVRLSNNEPDNMELNVDIICNRSDVWLSHPLFYFWRAVKINATEEGSSQFLWSGISIKFQLRKVSFLLTDGRWSCSGPQLEILMSNILLHANVTEKHEKCSIISNFQVNYNNIEKVSWEPFIEPWQFLLTWTREQGMNVLLNSSVKTDINLKSTKQLNINITESLVECVLREIEMVMDALGPMGLKDHPEGNGTLYSSSAEYMGARQCAAPYVLQNLTSLPLLYHVYRGPVNLDEFYVSEEKEEDGKYVQPGSAIPIYTDENTADQLFHHRPAQSSDSHNDQRSIGFTHHYITIQLDGTSVPSTPMSMDLVGVTCFEVNFSKTYNENAEGRMDTTTFVVPVVFEVSLQRFCKIIRIYSTVVLSNATSIPLELRFDIPLGVSPKILDPIHPGQQLPLPLHLAEAGSLRWRPLGHSYLWSEAHSLSKLLSLDNKTGNFKSLVCYPSHPSNDPFRCCLSVRNTSLNSSYGLKKNPFTDEAKKRFVHHMTLSSPLIVINYLPMKIYLVIESGGVNHPIRVVSEVETPVHHIDPSHDLGLEICIDGYKPSDFNFPRLDTFCTMAKFSGTKFSLSETLTFEPVSSSGPLYVTVEKVMDACCGTREVIIFVPFLLYNCTGFPLAITEATSKISERRCIIPSYYDLGENETFSKKKDGLSLLSSSHDLHAALPCNRRSSMKNHIISTRENASTNRQSFQSNPLFPSNYTYLANLGMQESNDSSKFQNSSVHSLKSIFSSKCQSTLEDSSSQNHDNENVVSFMYSPNPSSSLNDILVKVSRYFPEYAVENLPHSLWSSPFFLLPPSGSSSILVPQLSSNAAFVLAVTSSSVAEPYSGRTSVISFQPRYVISNACSKDISYKQKGTDVMSHLGIGEHAHLHWTDTTRDLLVSICYSEPGWQWSGSFLPDHLGDTQVKMRNFVSGTTNMIRVEVQNADISMGDEKIVGSIKGNSGTNLILLSDDNTGYMPYRIDNFSKERLRIYQQKCEMFETIVHSYTSCLYAWDEPCYPHRLMVEVPGERVLGSYALDDVKDYMPVYLPSTSEKPARTFFLSVHAEGPTKVLSVLDSNYHILNDGKKSRAAHHAEKRLHDMPFEYKEKISIIIPYIGISLINSSPQELLFACMKDIQTDLLQSLDRQSLSLQISFLQVDNQLRSTPYPVMLSFNSQYRSHYSDDLKYKNDVSRTRIEEINQMNRFNSSCDPVFCLSISKWKKRDNSFISFEYIRLRMADFCLEIEQEVILCLFEFFTNISSRFHYEIIPSSDPFLHPCAYDGDSLTNPSSCVQTSEHLISRTDKCPPLVDPLFNGKSKGVLSAPSVVPIGAPWQQIYLLARTQKKIYIEVLELAPINLTLSFSSAPWMLRNQTLSSKDSLIHRGLMALADVEGARIHLKELTIAHQMASLESIQDILIRHYIRQLLHEIYKLFGSAGVIGNPMGFVRSMGLGIKDFLQVPARSIMQSPTGLLSGMAQGTTSLLSNTVYAISDAASQFSKAARKGIVAFTYDDQAVSIMEEQQTSLASDSKGVINEVLEGLTGLLQSPIRGAERHGLPGVLSGIALGVTGLVAKPAASILEVTGKTALSIRNRSKPNQIRSQRFRVRLPRPLSSELPLRPYSWEEAVGTSVLMEADGGVKLKDEKLVVCKELKEAGKFVILTERYVLIVFCPNLVKLGKPEFCGILPDFECIIESETGLESVIHADTSHGVIHIVGSRPDTLLKQNQHSPKRGSGGRGRGVRWRSFPTPLPLSQTNLELASEEDADNFLRLLYSAIETGKVQGWGCGHFLHRANIKFVTD